MNEPKPFTLNQVCCEASCRKLLKGTFKLCAGCRRTSYCSQECQKKSWPAHRDDCKFDQRLKRALPAWYHTADFEFGALCQLIDTELSVAAHSSLLLSNPEKSLAAERFLEVVFDYWPAPDKSCAKAHDELAIRRKFTIRRISTVPMEETKRIDRVLDDLLSITGDVKLRGAHFDFNDSATVATRSLNNLPVARVYLRVILPDQRHWTPDQYIFLSSKYRFVPATPAMCKFERKCLSGAPTSVPVGWEDTFKSHYDNYSKDVEAELRVPGDTYDHGPLYKMMLREAVALRSSEDCLPMVLDYVYGALHRAREKAQE